MLLAGIHPHALKHGLCEKDIAHAWNNALACARRDRDDGKTDYLVAGVDQSGRVVEIAARSAGWQEFIAFHAMTPPTKRFLHELGVSLRQ